MTLKAIVTVNLLAVIVVAPMFVEGSFDSQVVPTKKDPKKLILACIVYDYSKDPRFKMPYSIYFLLRALLINIGPCTILVILNVILVKRMKEAKENRDRLIKKRQHETRGQEQTSVTLMLVGHRRSMPHQPACDLSRLDHRRDDLSHRGSSHRHALDHLQPVEVDRPSIQHTRSRRVSPIVELRRYLLLSH